MVEYLSKWYQASLMHPDWFVIKVEVWREICGNLKAVITVDHFSQGFSLGGMDENKKERPWEPILAPKLDGVRYFTTNGANNVNPNDLGAISAKSKYVDRIARYVDWAYTEEAAEQYVFGKEGYASFRNQDGHLQWKLPLDKFKWTSLVHIDENGKEYSLFDLGLLGYTHWFRTWEGFLYYTSKELMVWGGSSPAIVDWSASRIQWFKGIPNGFAPPTPSFAIPPDKQNRLKDLRVQIETATDEAIVQFVKGTRPLSEWDNYVKTLKDMGLDEALGIYRDAYKSFMAR
jgi:putative aldouronate transport system substrate-binding protein